MDEFSRSPSSDVAFNLDCMSAEEKIRASEERYHSLFSNMMDGFAFCRMIFDQENKPVDFVYLEINDAFEKITGLKRKLVIGKKVTQAIPGIKEANPELFEIYGRVALSCQEEKFEVFFKPLSLWLSISVYCPQKGYFAAIFEDITKSKKAQEALNKLNRHLRANSKSNQVLMHATDEATLTQEVCNIIINDCGYVLVWVGMAEHDKNKTVHPVAYAGFDKEYIDKLNITWADKPRGRGPTGTAIRTGKPYVCRNINLDPNFEPWREQAALRKYTASLALPLVTFGGKTFGALNIYSREPDPFSDEEIKLLTELANDFAYGIALLRLRKEREQAICRLEEYAGKMEELANERAKQLNQAERLATIGQTAGMVGHDIRNPLQAIAGELYLAKEEVASMPSGDAKKNLQENVTSIEENLYYIDKIVADLQDYTKPLRPNKEKVNVEKVIEEALLIVAIPSNLHVTISIEDGFPQFIADSAMLKRVFINLIQNAVQAMPNGGTLKINAQRQGNNVCLSVEDTGEGIPEEIKGNLFTPLFTTKSKGQGFGLAVVKRLVEAQDGEITFASQRGKGTTFKIQIPLKRSSS